MFELLEKLWAQQPLGESNELALRIPVYLDASEIFRPSDHNVRHMIQPIRGLTGQGVRTIFDFEAGERGQLLLRRFACFCPCCIKGHSQEQCWARSEEHTSELQSLMRISYAVF